MANIVWTPHPTVPQRGSIRVEDITTGYTLHWGDGFAQMMQPSDKKWRTFKNPGRYTASIIRNGEIDVFATQLYQVNEVTEPNVTVGAAPSADYTGRVTFTEGGIDSSLAVGRYRINWGTGEQSYLGEPGEYVDHYFPAGDHKIQVIEPLSAFKKTYTITITEPVLDPDFTVVKDPDDATGMTALLEVTSVPGAEDGDKLAIGWGDGSATDEIAAVVGTTVSHAYEFTGDFAVVGEYTTDPDRVQLIPIAVPFNGS